MNPSIRDAQVLWDQVVATNVAFARASRDFLAEGVDRVSVVRSALLSPGPERSTALSLLPYLKPVELQALFGELLHLASFAHGSIPIVREAIQSLPREWLLANIEQEAEPLLRGGTYDEYRSFLELYRQMDGSLALRLARRAAAHPDEDVREAGEDYLETFALPVHSESDAQVDNGPSASAFSKAAS